MTVIDVEIDQIDIGERRRQDLGDIGALAKGIERVGLLEPIIVDRNGSSRYRLVAGERRLQACRILKWTTIPASLREHLTDEELREIELEENENRKSFTEQERRRTFASAKRLVENARRAAEILSQSDSKPQSGSKAGRPSEPDSTRSLAAALGASQSSVVRAGHQVETAGRFPFMQDWRQSDVLRVRERLEELPDDQARDQTMAIIGAAKLLDPELTVTLVENLGRKAPAERQEIFELSQSSDPRQKSLALTRAAELPPVSDPRLEFLHNALYCLNAAIKPFPDDPLTPRLIAARREIMAIRAAVKEVSYDARRETKGATVQ